MNIGINLRKFRLLNNMSLKEAGKCLNISAPAIVKYEKGIVLPNQQRLKEFANAYNVNIEDLLQESSSNFKIDFKNLKLKSNVSQKNKNIIKDIIKAKITNYLEILELNNYNPTLFPKYNFVTTDKIELVSDLFRKQMGFNENILLTDLTSSLENIGIMIIYINSDYFISFETIIDNIPIIVLPNNTKKIDLATSLGRIILNSEDEKLSNRFARAFLIPQHTFFKDTGKKRKKIDEKEIYYLSLKYNVDIFTILLRLKELNIITNSLYKRLHSNIKKDNIILIEKTYQLERLICKLKSNNIIDSSSKYFKDYDC